MVKDYVNNRQQLAKRSRFEIFVKVGCISLTCVLDSGRGWSSFMVWIIAPHDFMRLGRSTN